MPTNVFLLFSFFFTVDTDNIYVLSLEFLISPLVGCFEDAIDRIYLTVAW
jgi:hypothetical protein